ncbi:MAG: DUF6391 domain-containing protein [Anaerolineae bacterium]|nr:DUF6391 domain-containing protein [Anaerolineae bacterium]
MSLLQSLLSISPVSRTRRHHALEHATLQILARKQPGLSLFGYSDARGFWVVGNVATETLRDAVDEALARLQNGETGLAFHPNCGTNYAVAGMLAGSLAWLVMAFSQGSWRRRLQDWPVVVALSTIGFMFGLPLGYKFQQAVTVEPRPGALKVVEIRVLQGRLVRSHRILTRDL